MVIARKPKKGFSVVKLGILWAILIQLTIFFLNSDDDDAYECVDKASFCKMVVMRDECSQSGDDCQKSCGLCPERGDDGSESGNIP